jgi:hypothetical protein
MLWGTAGGRGAVALDAGGEVLRRRLVGKSRQRDSSHGFNSGLTWEKESKEGNTFRGLRRGTGGWGRRTVAARGREAPASNCTHGKAGNKGENWPVMMLTPETP